MPVGEANGESAMDRVIFENRVGYLDVEANKMGLSVTAHLIAAAAESIRDQITQSRGNEIIANGTKH